MKKSFTILTIIALVCIFEACSKKNNITPTLLTGLEGTWNGILGDSFEFNLKPDHTLTGKDFDFPDTLKGSWSITDTIFSLTCFYIKNAPYQVTISAPVRKDSLIGNWYDNDADGGTFYLAKKK